jgi:small-conductance mechanosensitive channel
MDWVFAATGYLGEAWAFRVIVGLCIALITWRSARWAQWSFDRAVFRTSADPSIRILAGRLVYGAVIALGIMWILSLVGVSQAAILATFGALGLALSLALQDILKNFFAGLYLLFERPFLIGDEIQIREHVGRVEDVGFRTMCIRTEDNDLLVIPNAIVFAEIVANRTLRRGQGTADRGQGHDNA